jgi:hypothetical protein
MLVRQERYRVVPTVGPVTSRPLRDRHLSSPWRQTSRWTHVRSLTGVKLASDGTHVDQTVLRKKHAGDLTNEKRAPDGARSDR